MADAAEQIRNYRDMQEDYRFILDAFQDYVLYDVEASTPDYVREMLETVGIDEENAEKFGFEEYFEKDE